MARKGVELTEYSKSRMRDADYLFRDVDKGSVSRAAKQAQARKSSNRDALNAARRAMGMGKSKRDKQSTDSNQ